jgi:hypothetical protein
MIADAPLFRPGDIVWHRAGDDYRGVVVSVNHNSDCIRYTISWGDASRTDEPASNLTSERVTVS